MDQPLVSVIIPTYSRPDNLLRAIESVQNQTYKNIEIIVVDDNGLGTLYQEETKKLLDSYIIREEIKYICHRKNKNGSAARNTGFAISKGKFINFLDDDDELIHNKIEVQVNELLSNPNYDGCYCDTIQIMNGKKHSINTPVCLPEPVMEAMLLDEVFFNTSTILFTRKSISDLNGFDESFWRHQDWELYMRFFKKYKMCKAEKTHILKYVTSNIITSNPTKGISFFEYFVSKFIEDISCYHRSNEIYNHQYVRIAYQLILGGFYKDNSSLKNYS